ncbi:TPA: hypothetical protein EYN98_21625 [Candidatus Poribacteria bacterium]|nr:hypothetical protein [Candidatus Poribacteria bacterium]
MSDNKVVTIHQPVYLPWIGYFYKTYKSDIFIFWDTDQISKGGLGNRNVVKIPDGTTYITVPIKWKGQSGQIYKDVEIDNKHKWRGKHRKTLQACYARAEYFNEYVHIFEEHYEKSWLLLDDLNISLIEAISDAIGLKCKFIRASCLEVDSGKDNATARLIGMTKAVGGTKYLSGFGGRNYMDMEMFEQEKIEVEIYDFVHPVYRQPWGDFVPQLSIVDLLFNEGPNSLEVIKSSHKGE